MYQQPDQQDDEIIPLNSPILIRHPAYYIHSSSPISVPDIDMKFDDDNDEVNQNDQQDLGSESDNDNDNETGISINQYQNYYDDNNNDERYDEFKVISNYEFDNNFDRNYNYGHHHNIHQTHFHSHWPYIFHEYNNNSIFYYDSY
jgi:hypothetical protein